MTGKGLCDKPTARAAASAGEVSGVSTFTTGSAAVTSCCSGDSTLDGGGDSSPTDNFLGHSIFPLQTKHKS